MLFTKSHIVEGLGLGVDFTFVWDSNNNNNDNNVDRNPRLNFLRGTVLGDTKREIRDEG